MENTLILTKEPFIGFMPDDLRTWLHNHHEDVFLATALAEVHNHTGCLGHELDESNDRWLLYAYEEWQNLEDELYERILSSMQQANLCGKANYDLGQKALHYLVEPFMKNNGYQDGSGWWIKK